MMSFAAFVYSRPSFSFDERTAPSSYRQFLSAPHPQFSFPALADDIDCHHQRAWVTSKQIGFSVRGSDARENALSTDPINRVHIESSSSLGSESIGRPKSG